MKSIALFPLCIFGIIGPAQAQQTGAAVTREACSPANTGNNNVFNMTCGIGREQGQKLLKLANMILGKSLDPQEVMAKLDACIAGIAPWKLTDEQKAELKKSLDGVKAKIMFNLLPSDRNAGLLAVDLDAVFENLKWERLPGGPSFSLRPDLVGVILVVPRKEFPEAAELQRALSRIDIKAPIQIDESQTLGGPKDADLIRIVIGAKPSVAP